MWMSLRATIAERSSTISTPNAVAPPITPGEIDSSVPLMPPMSRGGQGSSSCTFYKTNLGR